MARSELGESRWPMAGAVLAVIENSSNTGDPGGESGRPAARSPIAWEIADEIVELPSGVVLASRYHLLGFPGRLEK